MDGELIPLVNQAIDISSSHLPKPPLPSPPPSQTFNLHAHSHKYGCTFMAFPVPSLQVLSAHVLCNNVPLLLANPASLKSLPEESCNLLFSILYSKFRLTYELVQAFKECGHLRILNAIETLDISAAAGIQTLPTSLTRRK